MDLEQAEQQEVVEKPKERRKSRKREVYEHEKSLKQYRKSDLVAMLAGVIDLPKDKIGDVYSALCALMMELSFTECVVHIPKFGRFIFDPKCQRKIWNPKEGKSLIYQNPKVAFKLSYKLRSLLRKQYRRNCYQLADVNKLTESDFKPPQKTSKRKQKV